MSALETMQSGVDYTSKRYFNENYSKPEFQNMNDGELQYSSIVYAGEMLKGVIQSSNTNDRIYTAYTRSGNLRYDMQALTKDIMKTELLKNIVNVASWHRINDTLAANQMGDKIFPNMSDDQISVVVFNSLERYGAEKGYELLDDPAILESACRTFAWYRRTYDMTEKKGYINDGTNLVPQYGENNVRSQLDTISKNHNTAIRINDDIDVYYARFCDRPKGVDTTVLENYGYDANGGFSGFGRK